jgi:hypothetical protein
MSDDKRLERIEGKIDDVSEHLSEIDVTLASQHVVLTEHIKRTRMLEEAVAPIKRHVDMVKGAIALVGLLATVAAAIEGIKIIMSK